MTFDEYVKATRATWRDEDPERLQIAHAAMGLAGEVGELANNVYHVPLKEEIGDCAYYQARLCDLLGIDMPDDVTWGYEPIGSRHLEIVEGAKKIAFQGADHDAIAPHLVQGVGASLAYIGEKYGFNIEEIREHNTIKLRNRYPSGFETGGGVREEGGGE